MGLLAHIFPAFASHNTNYVVLFFCLNDQSEAFDFLPVLPPGRHNIDPGGVDGAVTQNIRQLGNVLLNPIEGPGEEL